MHRTHPSHYDVNTTLETREAAERHNRVLAARSRVERTRRDIRACRETIEREQRARLLNDAPESIDEAEARQRLPGLETELENALNIIRNA